MSFNQNLIEFEPKSFFPWPAGVDLDASSSFASTNSSLKDVRSFVGWFKSLAEWKKNSGETEAGHSTVEKRGERRGRIDGCAQGRNERLHRKEERTTLRMLSGGKKREGKGRRKEPPKKKGLLPTNASVQATRQSRLRLRSTRMDRSK